MDADLVEQRLTEMRKKLEAQLERQQGKGGDVVVLTEVECEELFAIMKQASETIDGLVNGYV
jgi:hypothetical protein